MSRNISRLVLTIVSATAALTPIGAVAAAATPILHPDDRIAATMAALATQPADTAIGTVPNDFASTMGYRPQVLDAMVADPFGDCSSPMPLPTQFDSACMAHDLGYDMIRYAAATGSDIDPQWRKSIDAQLSDRMHDVCVRRDEIASRGICSAAATVAAAAVEANSWRQGYGEPAAEPVLPLALALAGVIAAAVLMTVSLTGLTGRFARLTGGPVDTTPYRTVIA